MRVDLPEPDEPTMATKSPRSIRNEMSRSASIFSPPGPRYVRPMPNSSIMRPSSRRARALVPGLAQQHLVSLAQPVHDLALGLVAAAHLHPTFLTRSGEDEGTALLATHRTPRHRQHVLARLL